MMPAYRPGQAVFRSVLPEDIGWEPLPPSARLAVVVGQPTGPGAYVVRVKVPWGVKLMPQSTRRTASTRSCPAFAHRPGRTVRRREAGGVFAW